MKWPFNTQRMRSNQGPIIHIGYTKAASTFLQAYFANNIDIYYPDRTDIYNIFAKENSLLFNKSKAKKYMHQQLKISGKRKLVFSHERLSGCPHSGFFDCGIIANLLCDMGEIRILIVIREQYDIISSIYKEYINNGGIRTLIEYLYPPLDGRIPLFDWKPLRYIDLISLYYNRIGAENIKIILFEEILNKPKETLEDLSNFIGVDCEFNMDLITKNKNTGIADKEIDDMRIKNLENKLLTTVSCERNIKDKWLIIENDSMPRNEFNDFNSIREAIQRYIPKKEFSSGNKKLGKLIKIDLSKFGYVT